MGSVTSCWLSRRADHRGGSAPTALPVRFAEAAGITLVTIARNDRFEIFTHGGRFERSCPSEGR